MHDDVSIANMTALEALAERRTASESEASLFELLFRAAESEECKDRSDAQPRALFDRVLLDHSFDTRFARTDARFHSVAHVFQQNWHGIRTAAGVLPGHKIALPAATDPGARDLAEVGSFLARNRARKVVFHGLSAGAARVARYIATRGHEAYLVWHGNLAQLAWEPECTFFREAVRACERGLFRSAHMMKSGMRGILPNEFAPMLLNSAPVVDTRRLVPAFARDKTVGLISAPNDIRKNLFSSVRGACLSKSLKKVFCYAKVPSGLPGVARCERIRYRDHDSHLRLLAKVDVSVNVTIIDCHPMVDMEALAMGAFPLTGPLHLDALQSHDVTRLGTIENPFDVGAIADRIDRLAAMDHVELAAMMSDYSSSLARISLDRYAEFLDL